MDRLNMYDKNIIQLLETGMTFSKIAYKQSLTISQLKKKIFQMLESNSNYFISCQDNQDLRLWQNELALGDFVVHKRKEYLQTRTGIQLTSFHYDSLTNLSIRGTMCHLRQVAPYYSYLPKRWYWYSPRSYAPALEEDFVGNTIEQYQNSKVITKEDYLFMVSYLKDHNFTVNQATVNEGLLYYTAGKLNLLVKEEFLSSMGLEEPFQLEKRVIGGKYRD